MRNGTFALLLLTSPASAVSVAPSQTLEALQAQAVQAPELSGRSEDAARSAGRGFEGSPFHISAPAPEGFASPVAPVRRSQPTAAEGGPQRSPTNRYYFEGSSPVRGITLYTARPDLTGDGRTGSSGPDASYGKYGRWALIGGAALVAGAFLLGGPAGIALGVLGGAALGVGALISWLFGKKS